MITIRTASRLLFALSLFVVALALHAPDSARAQDVDAQALRIERKLLCPQCTNLRLDVCDTQLCADMRAEIRERLARGESEQQIIGSFTDRYGVRVLAEVPATGFNRALFAWVAASLLLVAGIGALVLVRLRRGARAGGEPAPADERWLDEQLAAERETP